MRSTKNWLITFRNYIFDASEGVNEWIKEHLELFLIYLGIGTVVYFMLMSQNLMNSGDGLTCYSTRFAGRWELSIGRWFLPCLDRLRFGINSTSLNSFVTLMMIACGNVLIIDLFQIRRKSLAFLVGALFIATPVVCASLTFSFMSVSFGLAFLLSVLSAYCAIKISRGKVAMITAGWCLAWSMGCYQAYFSVTCIILLVYFLKQLFQDADKITLKNIIFKSVGTVVIGGFFYRCIVTLVNTVLHVELATYKDANNISLKSIILNLPHRIPEAYKEFFKFYFTNVHQRMIFGLRYVYLAAFLVTICLFLYKLKDLSRRNKQNALLSVLAIFLVPLASNAVIILITTPNNSVMTGGMTLLFSLFLCLFDGLENRKLLYSCYLCILIVLCWVNICIVNNDQIAMRDGKTGSVTIAQNIIARLADEGYIDSNNIFVFWGSPSANSMFLETKPLKNANRYAKFGIYGFSSSDYDNRTHWNGLFSGYCGVKFKFRSREQYENLKKNEEIKDMPCFPNKGSIRKIDDIVVVKVSDTY